MIYILLIIILVSILYYKYNDITIKYLKDNSEESKETFGSFSLLSNKGLMIETPLYKEYTIGSGEIDTPYFHFANAIEHISNLTNQCSFYLLLFIIKNHFNQIESIYDIKKRLCKYYEPLMNSYFIKICDILSKEGKTQFINMIKKQKITIETMIMNDDYMLTSMDIWIFANATQIPVILLDDNIVPNTNWLVLGGNPETDQFYFIKMVNNNQFNLITPTSMLRDLNGFQKLIESPNYENSIKSLKGHLDNYEITKPILNVRKQRVKKTK